MHSDFLNWEIFRRPIVVLFALLSLLVPVMSGAEGQVMADVVYKDGAALTAGEEEHCRLDLYLPADGAAYASILWMHGGGMTGGSRKTAVSRRVAERLASAGIAVAMADYRLNPAVRFPAYIDDVAAAFVWLRGNIGRHGGDPQKVFIGGHSAGAYLALMVALDDRYLTALGLDETTLAGVIALSGQTSTHFTVRAEQRSESSGIVVDYAAPLFHVRSRPFPFLILYAGSDLPMRPEENRLLATALRHAGCATVIDRSFDDRDHSTIVTRMGEADDAVAAEIIRFINATR
jgi:acetyl esterase/lipase